MSRICPLVIPLDDQIETANEYFISFQTYQPAAGTKILSGVEMTLITSPRLFRLTTLKIS
jgi:hypothetical protein